MSKESRKTGTELIDSETTESIIGTAIAVHRELGPGFLESIYEQALAVEFALRGIAFIRQHPAPLFYRDHQIEEHRLDFLVDNKIIGGRSTRECPFRNRSQAPKSDRLGRRSDSELLKYAPNGETRSRGANVRSSGSSTMNSCVLAFLSYV
jgi:hypothetical protein